MDRDLARRVATAAMRASKDLAELVPFISEHFAERLELKLEIAAPVAEIGVKALNPVYAGDTELEREFEERVRKLGRTT